MTEVVPSPTSSSCVRLISIMDLAAGCCTWICVSVCAWNTCVCVCVCVCVWLCGEVGEGGWVCTCVCTWCGIRREESVTDYTQQEENSGSHLPLSGWHYHHWSSQCLPWGPLASGERKDGEWALTVWSITETPVTSPSASLLDQGMFGSLQLLSAVKHSRVTSHNMISLVPRPLQGWPGDQANRQIGTECS